MYRTRPLDDNNFIEGLIGIGKIKYHNRKSGSNTLNWMGTNYLGHLISAKQLTKVISI